MLQYQLDMFKTHEESRVDAIQATLDKVRRGTYASINEVKRECIDLKSRLEIIERNICKGG